MPYKNKDQRKEYEIYRTQPPCRPACGHFTQDTVKKEYVADEKIVKNLPQWTQRQVRGNARQKTPYSTAQ
jgi:hypothetical protein